MWKSQIKAGTEYAIREKRGRGQPFQRVRVLEHVRGNKWKAEWVDPHPGLVHYVESGQIVIPWKEVKAFVRQEEAESRIEEHNVRQGYKRRSPIDLALEQIFESAGDDVAYGDGCLIGSPESIDRVTTRAGMTPHQASHVAFIDRVGSKWLPYEDALQIGRALCAAEPSTVLVPTESTERGWIQTAGRPGGEYINSLLSEYRASWALIRQWAGHDAAIAAREAEIQRLERLVWDAVYALQKAGLDGEAARLRRGMERR